MDGHAAHRPNERAMVSGILSLIYYAIAYGAVHVLLVALLNVPKL